MLRQIPAMLIPLFCNLGHGMAHMFMLLYPTAVLGLVPVFEHSYAALLALATPGFIAFGGGAIPAGWLADRWNAHAMMVLFFIGTGLASMLTGMADSPFMVGVGLTLIGVFASIYHPVGAGLLATHTTRHGKAFGVHGMSGNLGSAAGPFVAGTLTALAGWQAAFLIPGLLSVGVGLLYIKTVWPQWRAAAARDSKTPPPPALNRQTLQKLIEARHTPVIRLFTFLALATLCAGFIYQSTSVSLPKLLGERLYPETTSLANVGVWVALIYVAAAGAQLLAGHLADMFRARLLYTVIFIGQIPLLCFAAFQEGTALLIIVMAMVALNAGAIPIGDILIARYSEKQWRSSVYALKFVMALGVSAIGIPFVAFMEGAFSLAALYIVLAVVAVMATLSIRLLPTSLRHPVSA